MKTVRWLIILLLVLSISGCLRFGVGKSKDTDDSIDSAKTETIEVTKEQLARFKAWRGTPEYLGASKLSAALIWLILAAILGIGVSAALVFMGNKIGLGGIVGGIIVLILSLTVWKNMAFLAYLGMGLTILAVGALIYQVIVNRRAFTEVVQTMEVAKGELSGVMQNGSKLKLWQEAKKIQSDATERAVSKIKKVLRKNGNGASE